jgi:transposase
MSRKLPVDAFDFYFALGPGRSYQAVATRYGTTKRAVTNLAVRERWQERAVELEQKARESAAKKTMETLEEVNLRHLKVLRTLEAKAIEGMRNLSIETPADILRALDLALKQTRLILGEPSERTAISVEDVIKREYARWMVPEEEVDGNDV